MNAVRDWLERLWYGRARGRAALLPLSWLFAALVALRRALYALGMRRAHSVGRPVVVAGNLTVGGSGKTPLTLWLTDALQARGVRVGVVLRGYGRGGCAPLRVHADTPFEEAGDEAVLLVRRSGCPVAVGADRVAAAHLLAPEVDLIVADDGLQHLALKRDFEIVVIDGERRFGNGALLPAGPLREPPSRLASVDAVVVTGTGRGPGEISLTLEPGAARSLVSGERRELAEFLSTPVHAVAGIGHPERFFRMLETHGLTVRRHPFPDHHALTAVEVRFTEHLPVLMTEKDAVRCERFAGPEHWFVPVEARIVQSDAQRLIDSVLALLADRTPV